MAGFWILGFWDWDSAGRSCFPGGSAVRGFLGLLHAAARGRAHFQLVSLHRGTGRGVEHGPSLTCKSRAYYPVIQYHIAGLLTSTSPLLPPPPIIHRAIQTHWLQLTPNFELGRGFKPKDFPIWTPCTVTCESLPWARVILSFTILRPEHQTSLPTWTRHQRTRQERQESVRQVTRWNISAVWHDAVANSFQLLLAPEIATIGLPFRACPLPTSDQDKPAPLVLSSIFIWLLHRCFCCPECGG